MMNLRRTPTANVLRIAAQMEVLLNRWTTVNADYEAAFDTFALCLAELTRRNWK